MALHKHTPAQRKKIKAKMKGRPKAKKMPKTARKMSY